MSFRIHHQFFGPVPEARYTSTDLSEDQAYRLIGANTVAGFEPIVHTLTATGDRMRTPDGQPLTVVALHGTRLMSAIWFEQH
ncbi:hypothetical protein [Streptomyces microflavus]|uniref:hypothetical protein n=1 Tax=Streptomyces microflavus TaxID=1919 RepID=UPI002251F390|nr:hypothetical protein [Streptomyces microflavus]MCX4657361.1 hypothetical protein [Streptomyces microflavus]